MLIEYVGWEEPTTLMKSKCSGMNAVTIIARDR